MKLFTTLAIILLPLFCNAQAWNWANAYTNFPGLNSGIYVRGLKLDTTGNLVMSGSAGGDTTVLGNDTMLHNGLVVTGFVGKFENDGTPLWSKLIPARTGFLYDAIDPTDNGIYIGGCFTDSLTLGGTTIYSSQGEFFLARLDSNGDAQWLHNFGTDEAYWMGPYYCRIATDPDGNVYFGGKIGAVGYFATDTLSGADSSVFVVKYDKLGNEQWVKQVGYGAFPRMYELTVDNNKNIFLTGTVENGDVHFGAYTVVTPNNRGNSYLVKLDSTGTVQWAVTGGAATPYNVPGQSHPYTIGTALKGEGDNIYWTGGFGDSTVFGGNTYGSTAAGPYLQTYFLANYDQQGNFKWFKQGAGSTHSYGEDIETDGDGHIYVSGDFSNSITLDGITVNTPFSFNNNGHGDRFVAKYDTSGVCQWLINSGTPSEGTDMAVSCKYPYVFIAGSYRNADGDPNNLGIPVVVYSEDNIFLAAVDNAGMNCPPPALNVADTRAATNSLNIFPNPSSDYITIQLPTALAATGGTASVFNSMGQLVTSKNITTTQGRLDIKNYPTGIYYIRVTDPRGITIGMASLTKE